MHTGGRKELLGLVTVEFWAIGFIYLVLGAVLLGVGLASKVQGTLAIGIGCAILFGGLIFGRWRVLLPKSVEHVQIIGRDDEGIEIEPAGRTVLRAVVRLAVLAGAVTVIVLLQGEHLGDVLIGGMWFAAGLLWLGGAYWLGIWERAHGQSLLREARRWAWVDSSEEMPGGWRQSMRRVKSMKENARESGWRWFGVER
jgi:hypothetical protein